jgi:hypothetical protein
MSTGVLEMDKLCIACTIILDQKTGLFPEESTTTSDGVQVSWKRQFDPYTFDPSSAPEAKFLLKPSLKDLASSAFKGCEFCIFVLEVSAAWVVNAERIESNEDGLLSIRRFRLKDVKYYDSLGIGDQVEFRWDAKVQRIVTFNLCTEGLQTLPSQS